MIKVQIVSLIPATQLVTLARLVLVVVREEFRVEFTAMRVVFKELILVLLAVIAVFTAAI